MLEFRMLGPLEVRDGDRRIQVGGRNRRALLGALLLRANELVSTERLLDDLYGEQPPRTATQSLHNAVSQLRRLLGRDVVETHPAGYVLRVDPDALDLTRFEGLVARAREAAGRERAELLHEALGLWRGEPLADFADEQFAQTEILRLEEARLAAIEERIDADLELGRHADVVGELEALVARNPLRERLRKQLMLALYRSGRQADALAAYQDARRTLVDELGLEPSEELQELERAILQQDAALRLPPREAPAPVAPAPAGRRKTVTVLFSDLVESTALAEQLDPEVLHGVLSRYFEAMLAVLERHGGTVEKFIGDAIAAVFGVPVVHEDDALRAVRAAVDMRAALDNLNEDLERDLGVRLRAHTGINTGEVFTGAGVTGSMAAGDPGNVAARLQETARAGEIVIGEATLQLVRDSVTAEALEPLAVKGKKKPQHAYRVLAVTPMVGRAAELDQLRDAFEAAVAERAPRLFTVLGAAGVGKSRLVREFETRLGGDARVLRGRCLPYGEGISFWPVIEAVKQAADVAEDTPADEARARVEALVAGEDGERLIAARLGQLLGIGEGTASSDELAWAVRRLFEALARRRPLLLVLDDVHWGEPVFLDLVELLARSSAQVPLLVVCLARLELLETRPDWAGVRLTPLDDAESTQLVENLLGATLEKKAVARIRAAAEGNPLYVEELVAMLVDDGLIRREDGRWTPTGDLATLSIPATIGALLSARLERLPDDERTALETASIEGQVFHVGGVAELVAEQQPVVGRAITGLVHKDLIRPARPSFAGDDAYRFRHLLIRDAAYAALPKRRRADLHERFAAWVDERSADRLAEQDAIVGYHLEQAYRYGAELGKADEQLALSAGQRLGAAGLASAKRGDDAGAANLLRRATALLPDDPLAKGGLLCELGLVLRRLGQVTEADAVFADALAVANSDERSALRAKLEIACAALFADPVHKADELIGLTKRAIPVFQRAGDGRSLGRAWAAIGFVHMFRGENAAWEHAEEQSRVELRDAGWSASAAPGDIAAAAFQGPRPVREVIVRCRGLAEEVVGEPRAEAAILAFGGVLYAMLGKFTEARERLDHARSIYEDLGDKLHLARTYAALTAQVETLAGNLDAAEAAWRQGIATLQEIGDVTFVASHEAELADVLYAQGRYDEANEYSERAQERAAGDDVYTQMLWRLARAKILGQQGTSAQAEALAREAVDLASETDALVLIGRVHLALAEVLRIAGRLDDCLVATNAALGLFKRKGDVASAQQTRAFIRRIESERAGVAEVAAP
jgi:predicted ATPase/DNA-binding SARP family transcriptional activator